MQRGRHTNLPSAALCSCGSPRLARTAICSWYGGAFNNYTAVSPGVPLSIGPRQLSQSESVKSRLKGEGEGEGGVEKSDKFNIWRKWRHLGYQLQRNDIPVPKVAATLLLSCISISQWKASKSSLMCHREPKNSKLRHPSVIPNVHWRLH